MTCANDHDFLALRIKRPLGCFCDQARQPRSGCRLNPHPFRSKDALRVQYSRIGDRDDLSIRFVRRIQCLLAARRFADANRSRNRLRLFDRMPQHERSGSLRLHAQHTRKSLLILLEARPIRSNIARIADRQAQPIRRGFEHIANFECGCLLSFDAIWVDGIDQRDGRLLRDLDHERQRIVERSLNLDDFRAVGNCPRQLPNCYLPLGDQHNGTQTRARGIGSCRSCRVSGGSTDDGLYLAPNRFTDGGGHAAVFERTAWIQAFIFYEQVAVKFPAEARHGN